MNLCVEKTQLNLVFCLLIRTFATIINNIWKKDNFC